MIIRPEKHSDLGSIRSVHTVSFPNTNEARLVDELRTANRLSISLVAVKLHDVVGHVAFSPVIVNGAEGAGLGPVAVLPAYRRIGIGEQLIRKGLEACRKQGNGYVVVLGAPSYYSRFGFKSADSWELCYKNGYAEAFQAMELVPGAIPAGGGVVDYAPEFTAVDRSPAD